MAIHTAIKISSDKVRPKAVGLNIKHGIVYDIKQELKVGTKVSQLGDLGRVIERGQSVIDVSNNQVLLARLIQALQDGATLTKHVEGIMTRLKRS